MNHSHFRFDKQFNCNSKISMNFSIPIKITSIFYHKEKPLNQQMTRKSTIKNFHIEHSKSTLLQAQEKNQEKSRILQVDLLVCFVFPQKRDIRKKKKIKSILITLYYWNYVIWYKTLRHILNAGETSRKVILNVIWWEQSINDMSILMWKFCFPWKLMENRLRRKSLIFLHSLYIRIMGDFSFWLVSL